MKKFIAYFRVSRKTQEVSGLGLAAQKTSVLKYVESQNGIILNEFIEIETGTNKKKEGAILVIAKIDRLARNVSFVSSLMDAGVEFIACDMPSANNFTIHIFAALAEQEAKLISAWTSAALQELKQKGIKLGTPSNLSIEARNKGVITIKENALQNNCNRQAKSIIEYCKEKGMTYRQIAYHLNELNFKTRYGHQFLPITVQRLYNKTQIDFSKIYKK